MVINPPFGAADTTTVAIVAAGTGGTVTITSQLTIITTATLTSNCALALTAGSSLVAGAMIHLVATTNGTETITFSVDIVAPVITGVAGKTVSQSFMYNGSKFYPCGAKIQVN
jgi:hypothetical protein